MTVAIAKNDTINLAEDHPSLSNFTIGLGWYTSPSVMKKETTKPKNMFCLEYDYQALLLSSCAFVVGEGGRLHGPDGFLFESKTLSECGSVNKINFNHAMQDYKNSYSVDLSKVPTDVEKFIFTITINDKETHLRNFSLAEDLFVSICDENQVEIYRFHVGGLDVSSNSSLAMACELYRNDDGGWSLKAFGKDCPNSLEDMIGQFVALSYTE